MVTPSSVDVIQLLRWCDSTEGGVTLLFVYVLWLPIVV